MSGSNRSVLYTQGCCLRSRVNRGFLTMSEQNEHNRHVDPVQAGEIARLKALTDNPDGGVTVMGREERAVHAVLTMATVLYGALEDLMWGGGMPQKPGPFA